MKVATGLKINPFYLLKDNPAIWMATFAKEIEKAGSIESIGIGILFHLLDRDCKSWLYTYKRSNPLVIWKDFEKEFCIEMHSKYFEKLSTFKEKLASDDKVEIYIQNQINAFKEFFPKMTDQELILAAMSGLPKKIQIELDDYKSVKVNDFLHFCMLFDQNPIAELDYNQEE